MKKLIVLALLPIASFAVEQNNNDSNSQDNHSSTYSSGSQQNYQINNNNNARHRIGDVECSAPTVDFGLTDREGSGNSLMAYTSISIPLSSGTCKRAQETRLRRMQLDLEITGIEQHKKDILFRERMTVVCDKLHGSKHHMLLEECHGNIDGKHEG